MLQAALIRDRFLADARQHLLANHPAPEKTQDSETACCRSSVHCGLAYASSGRTE